MLRLFLLAAAAAFCLSTLACGDPATSVFGVVMDASEKPVSGVAIVLESQVAGGFRKEAEQMTGPDGSYSFVTITGSARYARLTFTKEGFKETSLEVPANLETELDVVLEKE